MKLANTVSLRAFCKPEEDKSLVVEKLKLLLPFDLEKEKIAINAQKAEGFEERTIRIITATLTKDRHIKAFLENLNQKLGSEKQTLIEQLQSRVDDDLNFYIRLDKEMMLKDKFILTDSGSCYHIKINLAAFPKKREKAGEIVRKIFG